MSDFLSKFGIMVAVAAFASLFMTNPAHWVKWGNDGVNTVTNTVTEALIGHDCEDSSGEHVRADAIDCTAQELYNLLILHPGRWGK